MCSKFVDDLNASLFQYNLRNHLRMGEQERSLSDPNLACKADIISLVYGRIPVPDRTQVAFKMSDIHWIETNLRWGLTRLRSPRARTIEKPHDRDKEPDIRLRQRVADEIVLAG